MGSSRAAGERGQEQSASSGEDCAARGWLKAPTHRHVRLGNAELVAVAFTGLLAACAIITSASAAEARADQLSGGAHRQRQQQQQQQRHPKYRRISSARRFCHELHDPLRQCVGLPLTAFTGLGLAAQQHSKHNLWWQVRARHRRTWAIGDQEEQRIGARRPRPKAAERVRSTSFSIDAGDAGGVAQERALPAGDKSANPPGAMLDPAQEACVLLDVDTPAVLLTAGAGTGKTHTLGARLARLVHADLPSLGAGPGAPVAREPGTEASGRPSRRYVGAGSQAKPSPWDASTPESILVLSFTQQGAQDVRERAVAQGLPRLVADRVWAATFHSFAASVLRQNVHLVWQDHLSNPATPTSSNGQLRLDIIGQTEQLRRIENALTRLNATDPPAARTKGHQRDTHGDGCSLGGGLGGSWGLPLPAEQRAQERAEEASRHRKTAATRARTVLSRLTLWKEKGLTPADIRDGKVTIADDTDEAAARIYDSYQQGLRRRRQVDFGDLCMMAADLFDRHPEVVERYRWRIRHVLVDEYQDTSPAQQRLLKALVLGNSRAFAERRPLRIPGDGAESEASTDAGRQGLPRGLGVSLFCAGDEDQHIYGWRGTAVDPLHSFEDDFPGAIRCTLRETHRLPVHLLRSATRLMRAGGLVPLLNRRMKTRTNTGGLIRAQGLFNSREEGKWVAMEAARMHREQGVSFKDMAVIARTSFVTGELEESLAARGVPYSVEGGSSFFARPELEAPLALLALCAAPLDDAAFRAYFSLRGRTGHLSWATPITMRRIVEAARASGVSLAEAVRLFASRGDVPEQEASQFIYGLRRWSGLLLGWPKLQEAERGASVWRILWEAGFLPHPGDAHLAAPDDGDGRSTPRELKAMTKSEESVAHLATAASRCDHLDRFLLLAARETEAARTRNRSGKGGGDRHREGSGGAPAMAGTRRAQGGLGRPGEGVEMMTMHQAKGREFKVVFLTGWDEGSFPLLPGTGESDGVESLSRVREERRLGYVALTRASKNAIITFSKKRRLKNSWIRSPGPSRFLLEMPEEYVRILPDAAGRALNNYPGLSVSQSLIFDGLIRAGKLRTSRPVLPDRASAFSSASQPRGTRETTRARALMEPSLPLPPGCTIINRSAVRSLDHPQSHFSSDSVLSDAHELEPMTEVGQGGRQRKGASGRFPPTANGRAPIRAKIRIGTERGTDAATVASAATEASSVTSECPSEARPRPDGRVEAMHSGHRSNAVDDSVGAGREVTATLPSNLTMSSADFVGARKRPETSPNRSDGLATIGRDCRKAEGGLAATLVWKGREPQSIWRRIYEPRSLASVPAVDSSASAKHTRYRYVAPMRSCTRGRRKKTLLDASDISAGECLGADEIAALVGDPSLQQASLKNYLRAVLAIQHGCLRGSIPVWHANEQDGGGFACSASTRAALAGDLMEARATGRQALSLCTVRDLATYAIVLSTSRQHTDRTHGRTVAASPKPTLCGVRTNPDQRH